MKIIVTTSNAYLHLIPVFEYLYMKYWGNLDIEIVGYEKPVTSLPFVSLGTQGYVSEWSTDLRRYFEKQPKWFVWLMEDTLLKEQVRLPLYRDWPLQDGVGRICLTNDISKREHTNDGTFVYAHPQSKYRQSIQPSIWRKDFLLTYLTTGLTPWDFETQPCFNDRYEILGWVNPPVNHNEGVRRFDRFKLDLTGMAEEDIAHIKSIAPWLK